MEDKSNVMDMKTRQSLLPVIRLAKADEGEPGHFETRRNDGRRRRESNNRVKTGSTARHNGNGGLGLSSLPLPRVVLWSTI